MTRDEATPMDREAVIELMARASIEVFSRGGWDSLSPSSRKAWLDESEKALETLEAAGLMRTELCDARPSRPVEEG